MAKEFPQPPAEDDRLSTAEAIALLRKTVLQLETVLTHLDPERAIDFSTQASVKTLAATTKILTAATQAEVKGKSAELETNSETETAPVSSSASTFSWWDNILNKIRSILPSSVSNALSNWALTGIISGLLVALLTGLVLLSSQQNTKEIAQFTPSTEIEPPPEITIPSQSTTETETEIVQPTPSTEIETPSIADEETLPETIILPSELVAPANPQAVVIADAPSPEPLLTPEQSLIAAIQTQVAEISDRYSEDLITSVEANFLSGHLLVTVSNDWYELDYSRQNKLANDMLDRSLQLDFQKLEVVDGNGVLIARSPFVGDKMIILTREPK